MGLAWYGLEMVHRHNKTHMILHYLPGKFILFDINQGVFDCFVHECVHAADEKVDGAQQRLPIFGQKLLGVSVVTKLLLKKQNQ